MSGVHIEFKFKHEFDINAELKMLSVSSPRGAPMGRSNIIDDPEAIVAVQRVVFVDGDYDTGGAYWGGGRDSQPLYCVMSADQSVVIFLRADSRDEAVGIIYEDWPDLKVTTGHDIVEVTNGYLEAVLFAERDSNNEDEGNDTSLEMLNFSVDDFHPDSVKAAREEVIDFLRHIHDLDFSYWDERSLGHDLYFSRNWHGCGFWDRGQDGVGIKLHDIAKMFGSVYAYVDEEGLVHISGG